MSLARRSDTWNILRNPAGPNLSHVTDTRSGSLCLQSQCWYIWDSCRAYVFILMSSSVWLTLWFVEMGIGRNLVILDLILLCLMYPVLSQFVDESFSDFKEDGMSNVYQFTSSEACFRISVWDHFLGDESYLWYLITVLCFKALSQKSFSLFYLCYLCKAMYFIYPEKSLHTHSFSDKQ